MLKLKRCLSVALGVLALAHATPAAAYLVNTSEPLVLNFYGPVSPINAFNITYGMLRCSVFESSTSFHCQGTDLPDGGTLTVFDGLDGSGEVISTGAWNDGGFQEEFGRSAQPGEAILADGRFSIVYSATVGSIEVLPFVDLTDLSGAKTRVYGMLAAEAPEPQALGLTLLALGAAGLARRSAAGQALRP